MIATNGWPPSVGFAVVCPDKNGSDTHSQLVAEQFNVAPLYKATSDGNTSHLSKDACLTQTRLVTVNHQFEVASSKISISEYQVKNLSKPK